MFTNSSLQKIFSYNNIPSEWDEADEVIGHKKLDTIEEQGQFYDSVSLGDTTTFLLYIHCYSRFFAHIPK